VVQNEPVAGRLDPDMAAAVIEASGVSRPHVAWPNDLTDREVDVLRLTARGLSNKEIATWLVVSPTHRPRVERLLGLLAHRCATARAKASSSEGAQGIAAGAHPGLIAVEMSTVGPDAIRALRESLPASSALLDAPVHGPPAAARAGSLAIFVGGDADVLGQARPVLELLGSVLHIGPLGSAAGAKLIVQTTLVGTLALLGEALALAEAFSVPREVMFDVLAQTPLASQAQRRRPMIDSGDYSASFRLSLARKDMDLVAENAQRAGLHLRLDEAGRSWLLDAEHDGRGHQDYTAIIATIQERAHTAPTGGTEDA
jgi:3-hydroxyisobutyrate dehydrogenase